MMVSPEKSHAKTEKKEEIFGKSITKDAVFKEIAKRNKRCDKIIVRPNTGQREQVCMGELKFNNEYGCPVCQRCGSIHRDKKSFGI